MYEKIRTLQRDEIMGKVGLILEGGANRGIFTSGVTDCLKENNIYLPYVISVSVGTCNAIDYVSKQIGRTKECMIPEGRNIPPINWRHILTKKTMINLDMVFDEYPNKVVPFDYDTYFSSDIESEYVVTNCHSGKAEYLSEKCDKKRLMNICRASCSMPYLCKMTKLDENQYLDGGISDAVPVKHAISKGFSKNIIVLTRAKEYSKKDSGMLRRLTRIVYKKYPNLIKVLDDRIQRYNDTMKYIEKLEAKKQVLIIRPEKVLVGRTTNNVSRMKQFYKQGYRLTQTRLEEIVSFIND